MLSSIDFIKYNERMKCKFNEQSTFWLIFELSCIVKPQIQTLAEQYSLTAQQFHLLGYLHINKQPQPMGALASILFCDASNITGIVDRLTALGFIERVEHPKDRRVKLVQLTSEGTKIYDTIMEILTDATEQKISESLSEQEVQDFRRILIKLLDASA